MARHADLTSIHQFAFFGSTDPGAVGAGKGWVDTSGASPVLRVRNGANTGWQSLGAASLGSIPDVALTSPQPGQALIWNGSAWVNVPWRTTIEPILDGGGAALAAGVKCDLVMPWPGAIEEVTLLADAAGNAVVDLWRDSYANYPPTVAVSICGSSKPTLSGAVKSTDATLAGWTTAFLAGDIIRVNLQSVATIARLAVAIRVRRTG